jgi:hypothetical protein
MKTKSSSRMSAIVLTREVRTLAGVTMRVPPLRSRRVGKGALAPCLLSSVQFSSVQFSSVQFSSVQFSSVQGVLTRKPEQPASGAPFNPILTQFLGLPARMPGKAVKVPSPCCSRCDKVCQRCPELCFFEDGLCESRRRFAGTRNRCSPARCDRAHRAAGRLSEVGGRVAAGSSFAHHRSSRAARAVVELR